MGRIPAEGNLAQTNMPPAVRAKAVDQCEKGTERGKARLES